MTKAEILALPAQIEPRLILASDSQTLFYIAAGSSGAAAVPLPPAHFSSDTDSSPPVPSATGQLWRVGTAAPYRWFVAESIDPVVWREMFLGIYSDPSAVVGAVATPVTNIVVIAQSEYNKLADPSSTGITYIVIPD